MRTIIFVDDEPRLLNALRRTLRAYRDTWRMIFVSRGQQALDVLRGQPVHVIVTDVQMPEMNGLELLKKVRERSPETLRIILTGHADKKLLIESVDVIHQYLQKPCDPHVLVEALDRSLVLQDNLTSPRLKSLVSQMGSLPSLPSHHQQLMQVLRSPDSNIEDVARVTVKDIALMARILHTVNSAYMGLPRKVSDPVTAVNLIGLDMVHALASTMQVFSQFDHCACTRFAISELWDHSLNVGLMAKRIAEMEKSDQQTVDDAFLAGLMHDVGKLILATQLPREYSEVIAQCEKGKVGVEVGEMERFGSTHAQVGAYLLSLWGVRTSILEAVAYHHVPRTRIVPGFSIIAAVHVANALDRGGDSAEQQIDHEYITQIGLAPRLGVWLRNLRAAADGLA